MKYYSIDLPAESEETCDIYPQVSFVNVKEAFKFQYNSFPNEPPALIAKLEEKAKLTDILSQVSIEGHGLLINEKVKNLLSDFNIMNHKYYSCKVVDHLNNVHQYYWLSLVQPELIKLIDFNNSVFYSTKVGFYKDKIKLTSVDDYLDKKKKLPSHLWGIEASKLCLYESKYDLFKLPNLYYDIIISEKLKYALIKDRITGVLIKEIPC